MTAINAVHEKFSREDFFDSETNMFSRVPFLEDDVKEALIDFIARLRKAEGDNLLRVVLFGSMARGDFDEESDTDIFVLLREGDLDKKQEQIIDLAYDASYGSDRYVLLSPFIETESDLRRLVKGFPRWNFEPVFDAIREEGVPLFEQGVFLKERIEYSASAR